MLPRGGSRRSSLEWDRRAQRYDCQVWLERRPLAGALELAAVQSHERLLDVGTGTGALLRLLARARARPELAVGLDSSPAMLRRTRRLPSSWQLTLADATAMPFAASSFDVVTCCNLLHLLARDARAQVIAECRRVLRRPGRLVTVTVAAPETVAGKAAAAPFTILHRIAPERFQTLAPLDPRPDIEAAGFTVERSRFVSLGYPSLCVLARLPQPGSPL